jgi:integrase
MARHTSKTQYNESHMLDAIAAAFRDFRADQVEAPDCAEFLQTWLTKARSYNAYRAMLRELMRFSIERGYRRDNPLDAIRTLPTPARTRYITDSELRRIKVGAIYGDDGKLTRSGRMTCALIDVAYLAGQRIGDLLELRWQRDPTDPDAPHVAGDGLHFRPSKTRSSTGTPTHITWTPRLQNAVERIRQIQAERLLKRRASQRVVSGYLFTGQDGKPLGYYGASSAWQRACARAGVVDAHFNDIRAKALTDKDAQDGRRAARRMAAHSTEAQTADYIRNRKAEPVKATR